MADIEKFMTPVFRGSFVHQVWKAEGYQGSEPKYGLTAVWDPSQFSEKDKKRWTAIQNALDAESLSRFKKKVADLPNNFKRAIRDGAEKADLDGFGEGTKFASITTKQRPGVVDIKRATVPIDDADRERLEAEGKVEVSDLTADDVYSGAYYRATVCVYSYENVGKGVALGLMNLQKVAEGERLDAGRRNAAGDFEDDEVDDKWLGEAEDDDGL